MKLDIQKFEKLVPTATVVLGLSALAAPAVSHAETISREKGVSMGAGPVTGGDHPDTTYKLKEVEVIMDSAIPRNVATRE